MSATAFWVIAVVALYIWGVWDGRLPDFLHVFGGRAAPPATLDPKRTYTRQDFVHVAQRDGLYCARPGCGDTNLQVDHIVPWSGGGPTTLDNAQLLCAYHNNLKSNRFVG